MNKRDSDFQNFIKTVKGCGFLDLACHWNGENFVGTYNASNIYDTRLA